MKITSNIDKYLKLEDLVRRSVDKCTIVGGLIWFDGKFGFGITASKNPITNKVETTLEHRISSVPSSETLKFPLSLVDALYLNFRHFWLQRLVSKYQNADLQEKQLIKQQSEYDDYTKESEEKFNKYFTNIR